MAAEIVGPDAQREEAVMAANRMSRSNRLTPAEQAERFKAAQVQMKEDAARRRLEAEKAAAKPTRRRRG